MGNKRPTDSVLSASLSLFLHIPCTESTVSEPKLAQVVWRTHGNKCTRVLQRVPQMIIQSVKKLQIMGRIDLLKTRVR